MSPYVCRSYKCVYWRNIGYIKYIILEYCIAHSLVVWRMFRGIAQSTLQIDFFVCVRKCREVQTNLYSLNLPLF